MSKNSQPKPDRRTPERLVIENEPLARWYSGRQARYLHFMEMEDIYQHCMMAMWRAAKAFDPMKGNTFSTLAVQCMRYETINLHHKHHPDGLKYAPEGYQSLRLDMLAAEGEAEPLISSIPDSRDEHKMHEAAQATAKILQNMPERSRNIVFLRMTNHTLQEIADQHGITRERVRQICLRAGKYVEKTA